MSIPKIIHYCWFSDEKDERFFSWLSALQLLYPDWRIIEWNKNNIDLEHLNYAREALMARDFESVKDVVCLKCIYEVGGIFLNDFNNVPVNLEDYRKDGETFFFLKEEKGVPHIEVYPFFGGRFGSRSILHFLGRYQSSEYKGVRDPLNLDDLFGYGFEIENKTQFLQGIYLYKR